MDLQTDGPNSGGVSVANITYLLNGISKNTKALKAGANVTITEDTANDVLTLAANSVDLGGYAIINSPSLIGTVAAQSLTLNGFNLQTTLDSKAPVTNASFAGTTTLNGDVNVGIAQS